MPGSARKDVVREGEIGTYHTWSRCVQRAFLCGYDPLTGINYDYRRQWIEDLIRYQTSVFCVEVANYTILSNHQHLICRTRPDLVLNLSDEEVAWRWKLAWPQWTDNAWHRKPTDQEIEELLLKPQKILKIRQALGSLSWFMARIKEPIARLANEEAHTSGHYYESRFGCRELADEEGGVVCSLYLDVNQYKAGLAASLEESHYSAIRRRILAWKKRELQASLEKFQTLDNSQDYPQAQEGIERLLDEWLLPIKKDGPLLLAPEQPSLILPQSLVVETEPPAAEPVAQPAATALKSPAEQEPCGAELEQAGAAATENAAVATQSSEDQPPAGSKQKRGKAKAKRPQPTWKIHERLLPTLRPRPSDNSFLGIPEEQYLELAQCAVERLRNEQSDRPPPAYLQQRNLDADRWYAAVEQFEHWFGRAVGRPQTIEKILQRSDRRWLHGLRRCRATFS